MKRPDFYPVRSLIYVDLAKEDYRIHLENWLYRYHIPDSISQFGPYVSKYAFYQALPVPEGGERFGTVRMQMTEHYWLANPNDIHEFVHHKALTEDFPYLKKSYGISGIFLSDIARSDNMTQYHGYITMR